MTPDGQRRGPYYDDKGEHYSEKDAETVLNRLALLVLWYAAVAAVFVLGFFLDRLEIAAGGLIVLGVARFFIPDFWPMPVPPGGVHQSGPRSGILYRTAGDTLEIATASPSDRARR